jgi:hypothetical protein
MNRRILKLMAATLVGWLLLTACQAARLSINAAESQPTSPPTPIPLPEVTEVQATRTPSSASQLTAGDATATSPAIDPAVQTVREYFAALQNKDFVVAADLISIFSLAVDGLTRGDAAEELHNKMQAGTEWSSLQVKDSRVFTDKVHLVHVTYTLTTRDAKTGLINQSAMDELWPVVLENNRWLYNRNNLIDFRTLSITDQTVGGLLIKPLELARFSDHLRMTMLVQNTTDKTIVLGLPDETMAAFIFDDHQFEADKKPLTFEPLRTYSRAMIELTGLFTSYPDGVIIRQWKNFKAAPWFTFRFDQ